MNRLIIFIGGIICIFFGCEKTNTKSEAFINTVEVCEKSNLSDYDYFKLSEGFAVPYIIGEKSELTGSTKEFVYPLVSKNYLDSLYAEFVKQFPSNSTDQDFMNWFDNLKSKPKIYVQSNSRAKLNDILNDTNSTEINIEGTRLLSFIDLDDNIKEALEKTGITPENTLFIEEGGTPSTNKGLGWFMAIVGGVIVVGSIISFMNKVEKA